jgi:TPP-dependent pyruvate/acetoin dehydrogenase alpha subunit
MMTKDQLIAFETRIKDLWEAGDLPFLLHLSGGNEEPLIELFKEIRPGDWVFSGHRSHYHYLLAGGSPSRLEKLIRAGRSMFVFDRKINFVTSSILAGCCGIAAGVAWAVQEEVRRQNAEVISDKGLVVSASLTTYPSPLTTPPNPSPLTPSPHVWCFLGDGAEDEGHFYEAVRFVDGHRLPCTFIIEDNNRSVETRKADRRGPDSNDAAILWPKCVRRLRYMSTYPHAGSGCKHHIEFKSQK